MELGQREESTLAAASSVLLCNLNLFCLEKDVSWVESVAGISKTEVPARVSGNRGGG